MPYWKEGIWGTIWNIQYNFNVIYFPWKWGTTASEVYLAQVLPDLDLVSKQVTHYHYVGGALQLLYYKVSTKTLNRGFSTPQGPLWACPDPRVQGRGCPTQPINFWEGPKQLWLYKLSILMSEQGSRRTWGPRTSWYGFGVWKGDQPPLNWGCPATFVYKYFAKMHGWGSSGTSEPLYTPHTHGFGGTGLNPPWLPPLCTISSRSIQQFVFL